MMKRKRIISMLISAGIWVADMPMMPAILPQTVLTANAAEATKSGTLGECQQLTWTLDAEGTLTISGSGSMALYGDEASFSRKSEIKTVVIEEGVTSIAAELFYGCANLTSITIPESLTEIGRDAFEDTAWMKAQRKKDPLVILNGFVVYGKSSKGDVVIPEGVRYIANWAFRKNDRITSVTFPDSLIGIGEGAFDECTGLTEITIPDGTVSIKGDAFSGCENLSSVSLPASVQQIVGDAFKDTAWQNKIAETEPVVIVNNIVIAGGKLPEDGHLVIPDGVSAIAESALHYYNEGQGFTALTIPDSVTTIGKGAFAWCGSLEFITIPESVTSIGYQAFLGTEWQFAQSFDHYCVIANDILISCKKDQNSWDLTYPEEIIVPDGIRHINEGAFHGNDEISSIILPDSVTSIGKEAFTYNENLTSVIIPDSVKEIGEAAFNKSENVTIKGVAGSYAETYAKEKGIPFEVISDVQKKGDYNGNGSVTVADAVLLMRFTGEDPALTDAQIEKLLLAEPDYDGDGLVTILDVTALLEKLEQEAGNKPKIIASGNCGAEDDNLTWTLDIEGTLTITGTGEMIRGDDLLYSPPWSQYQEKLKAVKLPDGITYIGNKAFQSCVNLTEITIPDGVTYIGEYAFSGCTGLTDITIPESVTSIDYGVFSDTLWLAAKQAENPLVIVNHIVIDGKGCTGAVSVPDGVTAVAPCAFYGCKDITSITFPESITSLGYSAFANCTGLTELTIPRSISNMENGAFKGCSGLTAVTLADGIQSIGDSAFHSCSSLTGIVIPDSVTSIGKYAFYNCSALTDITISESLTSFGGNAFSGTKWMYLQKMHSSMAVVNSILIDGQNSIGNVKIPDGVKVIGEDAFSNCSNLIGITIPDSVTEIRNNAFYYCTRLPEISIPESVTSIGSHAFYKCESLTEIQIPDSVTEIGSYAFNYCTSLTSVVIPDSVTTIESGMFSYCTALTDITIPNGVTSIGQSAFCNCCALTEITIPQNVTYIGSMAFESCSGLTSVVIPESVETIWWLAFYQCTGLTDITIKNPHCTIYDDERTIPDNAVIHSYSYSTAEAYAKKYGRTFD